MLDQDSFKKIIEEQIVKAKGDFRFELSIVDRLKDLGLDFNWQHGGFYEDAVSGKIREFDLRIEILDEKANTAILLPIEIKNLKKSKWLVHQSQRPIYLSRHEFISSESGNIKIVEDSVLHPFQAWVGKSVNTVGDDFFKNGKSAIGDTSHEFLLQSIGQSKNLLARAIHYSSHGMRSIIAPLVVVPDDSLIVVNYLDSEKFDIVDNVSRVSVHLERKIFAETVKGDCELRFFHVDVVTSYGLNEFITFVAENIKKICDEENGRCSNEQDEKPYARQESWSL